jgi:DNA-binding CsgD family transcriptional regulator
MLLQGYSNKEIKKKLNFNDSSMSVNKYRLLCKLRGKLDLIKEYNKYDYQYCPF